MLPVHNVQSKSKQTIREVSRGVGVGRVVLCKHQALSMGASQEKAT